MIKKILGLGLFIIGFFGFSYGAKVEVIGLDSFSSSANSNFNITVMRGGSFLTNYLGVGKSVLAFNNQTLLFRHKDTGLPYYYHRGTSSPHYVYQGYFGSYYLCNQITGTSYNPSGCSSYSYNGDYDIALSNFFNSVNAGDYFYYDTAGSRINVCWSSSSIGSSFCLRYSNCSHAGSSSCSSYGTLVNSNDYGTGFSFSTITNNIIGYAPGQGGYGGFPTLGDGSLEVSYDTSFTGDYTYSQCTYGDIIDYVESAGVSVNLCYGGINNFDDYDSTVNYNPIPGSGKSLGQILVHAVSGTWQTPLEWFNFWNGLYIDRYNNNYNAMWESYPAVYRTWFDLYYTYGGNNYDFDVIREYCILKDLDIPLTGKYNGTYFKNTCNYIENNRLDSSNSGENIVGLNWNGVGNLSGMKNYNDPGVFITDMFTKLKSYIPDSTSDLGVGGFLPTYIIMFMLFLILFRFLSH